MKNGIVIPCYNEADRIDFNHYRQFIMTHPNYQLCFVNDGSKDATLQQLNNFKTSVGDQVIVHNMAINGGKAEAVRQGIKLMEKETEVDNIGFLDADLATGFDDYKRLVDRLNQNNLKMVFGSRKLNNNIQLKRSGFRKFASLIISMIINLITKMDIKDTQCGAKVFSRKIIQRIFTESFHSRWLFDVEIFIRIKNYLGSQSVMSQVSELGLNSWNEVEGSKITLKDSLKFPITLVELAILYNIVPKIEEINRVLKSSATYLSKSFQILNQ